MATSSKTQEYYDLWQQAENAAPGEFSSAYTQKAEEALSKYENRTPFVYNPDADVTYQTYKSQYEKQADIARKDTYGTAIANSGGYNNSYAQTASQQVYQDYMKQLTDMIPSLRAQAKSEYDSDTNELLQAYSIYAQRESDDYTKYRNSLSDYENNRSYWYNIYQNAYADDYQRERDAVADAQWQQQYDQSEKIANLEAANSESAAELDYYKAYASDGVQKFLKWHTTDTSKISGYDKRIMSEFGYSDYKSYIAALIAGMDLTDSQKQVLADYYGIDY